MNAAEALVPEPDVREPIAREPVTMAPEPVAPEPVTKAPEPVALESIAKALELFVTPAAARKIHEALVKRGTPNAALRVGVRGGGCSGFSYVLEFSDAPAREGRDLVFTAAVEPVPGDAGPIDGGPGEAGPGDGGPGEAAARAEVKVLCDKKSIIYLAGSTLDWEKTLKWQGFKFVNPHSKQQCGCKESFSV